MFRLFAAVAFAGLLGGCDQDPNTPGVQINCPTAAPQLAGVWTTTLSHQPMSITLTEQCSQYLFGSPFWYVNGEWTWSGQRGNAFVSIVNSGVQMHLRMGNQPQPLSFVVLDLPTAIPITNSRLNGIAHGVWRVPTDTTRIFARFDSVQVALERR